VRFQLSDAGRQRKKLLDGAHGSVLALALRQPRLGSVVFQEVQLVLVDGTSSLSTTNRRHIINSLSTLVPVSTQVEWWCRSREMHIA